MAMKRIFMVGYSGNRGGVETYIDQISSRLSPEYEIVYSMPEMNLGGKKWSRPRSRHRYLSYRLFWRRFFRENRFDILYYNTCDLVSIDMLRFAKRAGIPFRVIHAHSPANQREIQQRLNAFHRMSERRSRKRLDAYATHFLACSREAGEWMFDGRPFTVIRNGITVREYAFDPARREEIRRRYDYSEETLLVGIIGRLSPQKNPSFAVKALRALFQRDEKARAVFLGEGELRGETEEACRRAGILERVRFAGAVSDVNAWMSALDVLLMPSLFEGMPFTLVEAQAAGLPCVVSGEISREADLTGELMEFVPLSESPEAWAERLISKRGWARKDYTRQIAEAGYDADRTAEQVRQILKQAEERMKEETERKG